MNLARSPWGLPVLSTRLAPLCSFAASTAVRPQMSGFAVRPKGRVSSQLRLFFPSFQLGLRLNQVSGLIVPFFALCGSVQGVLPAEWRPGLFSGVRVGEALNPGPVRHRTLHDYFCPKQPQAAAEPPCDTCVFAVVNPTSVLHKVPAFLATGADFLAMSETSAVERVQGLTGNLFRKHGFKVHWGAPVPSHTRVECEQPTLRGLAAGVGLAARLPSRASQPPLPEAVRSTCRLAEAFIRLGALEVRVLTLYGFPLSDQDAKERTNLLLQTAFDRASQNAVPCIVAGDFNVRPFEVPAGQAFQQQGYQDVFDLHLGRHSLPLPPTCKGSTRHDTALLHPAVVRLWHSAWVLNEAQLFDSHDPLCFRLHLCSQRPCTQVWRLPRPFAELGVHKQDFATAFQQHTSALRRQVQACSSVADVDGALQAFAKAAEASADAALLAQWRADPVKSPHRALPKSHRGRCLPRPLLKRESACLLRPDWQGGYNPDVEVTSVLCRLRVRQVRRLLTFQRGLAKFRATAANSQPRQECQLLQEWRAIVQAKGYPPAFPTWVLQVACFHHFPCHFPPPDWLDDLLSYVRYDCDCLARQEAKRRKDTFLAQVSVDVEVGHSKQGFKAIRAAANPPFTEVPCQVRSDAAACPASPETPTVGVWYQVRPDALFRAGCPAKFCDHDCQIVAVGPSSVCVAGDSLPTAGQIQQHYVACTAEELHSAFADFWGPLWQRDGGSAQSSLTCWPQLRSIVEASGVALPSVEVRIHDPALWQAAINRMSRHKATGICGWAPSDLKLLPPEAVDLLSLLFERAQKYGLPEHILRTKVSVLAKVFCPTGIHQSRPITVFSTLYRIWASVATRQLLQAWVHTFPPSVSGSMPGRSSRDVSYRQQHLIEKSLVGARPRLGFSLDIVKCFNQLGWPPLQLILQRMGAPTELVDFWLRCLSQLRRHTSFLGDLSHGLHCCNGAPEGDPLSVAALAAVCCLADAACHDSAVQFDTYVDNWSWSGTDRQALLRTIPKAVLFLQSQALPVDWSKSYTWATNRSGRKWWCAVGEQLFPPGAKVKGVSEVRDLGVAFRYDGLAHAGSRSARLQDGLDRLDRLRHQPRSPSLKASMIQRGVWTACLYGAEGHCFTQAEYQLLRGRAARAIVGQHKILSPFLALAALSAVCQDPQLYCLNQQLQQLRRTCRTDPDLAFSVLELATQDKQPKGYQGPASALRKALDCVGLTLTSAGILKGCDNTWADVTCCRASEIKELLQHSWVCHVQKQVAHRNGLAAAPEIYTTGTAQLFSRLSSSDQMVVARHITGAFSSAAAKNKWQVEIAETCPFCGTRQTKAHKFLSCPAFQHVRAEFSAELEYVAENRPSWIHAPYASVPPDLEIVRLVFATRTLRYPDWPVRCPTGPSCRTFLRFFTDGSCRHPNLPLVSHAGWAVVMDVTESDSEIPGILSDWRFTGRTPTVFQVVLQGLVPGVQSINRAEECAVLQAARLSQLEGPRPTEIWTDSAFAIAEWNRVADGRDGLWPDLADELRKVYQPYIRLHKVASHQDIDKLWGMEQWLAAGNAAADDAAKAAVLRDLPGVIDITDKAAQFLRDQADHLRHFWNYLLRLSAEEARHLKQKPVDPTAPEPTETLAETATGLDRWSSLNTGTYITWDVPPYQREWLLACSWPPWYTAALWHWLQGLKWSTLVPEGRAPPGVAYVELLADFVFTTGVCPPAGNRGASEPLPGDFSCPSTVRQLTHSLVEAVRQLEKLTAQPLWPERKSKVFALRALGYQTPRIGLKLRPLFENTKEVGQLLCAVLQQSSVKPLQVFVQSSTVKYTADEQLQRFWSADNPSKRAERARALRRSRTS